MQDCGIDQLCRFHSIVPATHLLLGLPFSLQISPTVEADFLNSEGASTDAGPSPHLQLLANDTSPALLSLLFLFPFPFFHPSQLCGNISHPFVFFF